MQTNPEDIKKADQERESEQERAQTFTVLNTVTSQRPFGGGNEILNALVFINMMKQRAASL